MNATIYLHLTRAFVLASQVSVSLTLVLCTSCQNLDIVNSQRIVRVEIWGTVNQPGFYQVPETTSAKVLLALGGGVSSGTESSAPVIRHAWFISEFVSDGDDLRQDSAAFSQERHWRTGDMLLVFGKDAHSTLPYNTNKLVKVAITGGVQKEGVHWVSRDACLVDLFRAAGGVSSCYHNDSKRLVYAKILTTNGAKERSEKHVVVDETTLRTPLKLQTGDHVMLGYQVVY